MSYLDLNNDVKSIISKHLSSDYKISTMFMSKHYDDFNNAKIYKMYNVLNYVLYIGVTCDALASHVIH